MDGEIDELTAALFEEAYKMVNGAHERRAKVEKHLEDVRGKVSGTEVLDALYNRHFSTRQCPNIVHYFAISLSSGRAT